MKKVFFILSLCTLLLVSGCASEKKSEPTPTPAPTPTPEKLGTVTIEPRFAEVLQEKPEGSYRVSIRFDGGSASDEQERLSALGYVLLENVGENALCGTLTGEQILHFPVGSCDCTIEWDAKNELHTGSVTVAK